MGLFRGVKKCQLNNDNVIVGLKCMYESSRLVHYVYPGYDISAECRTWTPKWSIITHKTVHYLHGTNENRFTYFM